MVSNAGIGSVAAVSGNTSVAEVLRLKVTIHPVTVLRRCIFGLCGTAECATGARRRQHGDPAVTDYRVDIIRGFSPSTGRGKTRSSTPKCKCEGVGKTKIYCQVVSSVAFASAAAEFSTEALLPSTWLMFNREVFCLLERSRGHCPASGLKISWFSGVEGAQELLVAKPARHQQFRAQRESLLPAKAKIRSG